MHITTSSLARSVALLLAFALLSCTASGDETGSVEVASLGVDAGAPIFAGGIGTESSPYQVGTCAQLQNMETALYSYFVITADIDCTGFDAGDGHGFRPIGTASEEFMGRVNGGEHVITGLHIDRPTQDRVGVFGAIRWAIIKDLGLVSPSIEGHDEVGAFIGRQRWGLLERVFVRDGEVVGNTRVGAMVGLMDIGKIFDSYAQAALTCAAWDGYSGGPPDSWTRPCGQLAGDTIDGIIQRSYAAVEAAPHFGLAGGSGTRTHTAAFYDCDIVSGCSAPHSELRTTTQLQSEVYLAGQSWDFTSIWDISPPVGYPCLQWEPGCGVPTCSSDDTTCDGVDDDCDSSVDEDFAPAATSCGVGACGATGTTSCVAGEVEDSCEAGTPSGTDATCDGIDQDCDGTADDGYVPTSTTCGVGACGATGSTSCVSGEVEDSCEAGTPGTTDATCDGIDQDCDGTADDGYVPTSTTCGVGACGATGTTSCVAGEVEDSCEAGSATGTDANCDGIDQDCDGTADDGYVPTSTTCGVGACGATGVTSCVAGEVEDSCEAGSATGTDTTCDGVDQDCDGIADDGYVPTSTTCGVGACGATGVTSCVSGSVVDSCEAGTPAGTDTNCDGIDQDCDGTADDGYVSTSTSCGVGACAASGATSCVSGSVEDSCDAGTPVGTDASCDGIDQDCDGAADDGYVPTGTSCGVGACGSTGVTSCVSGSVADSCEAGAPAGTDAACDGVDTDCDGSTDEAFVGVPTACGLGACVAAGATTCVSGFEVDTCDPGTPASSDDCGGIDDDCDGTVDEDCCEPMTCVDAQATCGTVSDGCGGTLSCGTCLAPEVCGAGGEPNVCGLDQLPPDPASIAPAAPPQGLSGTLLSGFSFLFEHDPPVQMGADEESFDERRVSVIQGCVEERTGEPLAGVRVSLLDRPEHGYTFSREDGCYTLVINGGGNIVLNYAQDNYLPAQRAMTIGWSVFGVAPTVALVRQSHVATRIDFGSALPAVAVGETQVDDDGERTPTVYFPSGVTAAVSTGSGTVPVPTGNLRMTEFTVGEGGVRAMPGSLPTGTLYTFAMDLSFDEVGPLDSVVFNRDVYLYLTNFLGIPKATEVPNGYYDLDQGRWVEVQNGLVFEVVGVSGGLAQLDGNLVAGADTVAELAQYGITEEERRVIAEQFEVGDTFWRMPMRHFTAHDVNFNGVIKEKPDLPPKPKAGPAVPEDECRSTGSTIYCHRRALGEDVPVSGTGLSLHYQSDRIRGNTLDDRTLEIDFTGMMPPEGAIAIRVHVEVMGRVLSDVELPVSTERHIVVWDGLDAYGRAWNQPTVAEYAVEWVTQPVYRVINVAAPRAPSFGGVGGVGCNPADPCCVGGTTVGGGTGSIVARLGNTQFDGEAATAFRSEYTQVLGAYSAERVGLGGFGLSAYHTYSPSDGRLLLGDGDDIEPREPHAGVFAGSRSNNLPGHSTTGPASSADLELYTYSPIAASPDGYVYFTQRVSSNNYEIWAVSPAGLLEPVLANATLTPSAWASWISHWNLSNAYGLEIMHLATDARGRLYFVDEQPSHTMFRMTRVDGGWVVEHIAGAVGAPEALGQFVYWEDGGSAKRRMSILDMTVSSSGTPYLQVSSPTVAGVHLIEITAGGTLRRRIVANQQNGLAAGPDGSVVVRQSAPGGSRFIDVRLDGSWRVLAGGGAFGLALADTHPAADLRFTTNSDFIAGPDGALYFVEVTFGDPTNVYRVDGSGMAQRLNLTDALPVSFPAQFPGRISGLAVDGDGAVYVAQRNAHRILKVTPNLSEFDTGFYRIASADGSEIFVFNSSGVHLHTLDAVTGVQTIRFEHDAAGQLVGVVDRDGRRVDIERVGTDEIRVHAPEGPGGERVTTTMLLNEDGYGEQVTDAAGASWTFRYDTSTPDAEGLLREMWAPRSNSPTLRGGDSYTFDYERFERFDGDTRGPWLLVDDTDPLGRVVNLQIPATTTMGAPGHDVEVEATFGVWCDGSSYQTGWSIPRVTTTVYRHNGAMLSELTTTRGASGSHTVSMVSPDGRRISRQEPDANGNGSSTWPGGAMAYHTSPDPLVGEDAPYVDDAVLSIGAVSGRTALLLEGAVSRTVVLDPADAVFPYTVQTMTETSTVNGTRTTTAHYNAATRTYTTTSPEGRVSQRITDALGRTVEVRAPGQLPTHFDYDGEGYLTAVRRGSGASERRVDYTYDARGYMNGLTTRVDPTRNVSVVYGDIDGRGQPREATVPGISATMSMEPDVVGAPISVSPPGQPAHGFDYSIIGQATEYRPPGVAEVPDPVDCPAGATCTVYDVERRIDEVVQADGQVLDLTYNTATGQLTSVDVPDDGTYTFSYYPGTGNINTVTGPAGTSSVQTLWQSDLPIASILTGPVAGRVDVTYNHFLEVSDLAVTGGHGVRYTYDRDGLVVGTTRMSGPSTAAMTLTRAALDGHVEQDVLGVVQTGYAVDVSASTPGFGDYEGSTVRVSGSVVYESHYEHDALGRITEWAETVQGTSRVQRFEYDDGGRLLSVRDGLDAPVADYGYDLNGNRTSVVESAPARVLELGVNLGCADSGGTPLARGANDRDELCRHGDHDYAYDTNGRLQTRVNVADPQDETVYTYDGGGRLQAVAHGSTTIEYVHDALGRRVGRVVNGVFERGWLYKDSLNPIAQVNAAGAVEATYVYVTRANVPDYIVTSAGVVYRVVSDHLGSVRMLVNAATGAVTERYDYDVWGRVTFESGDHSLHPFGYAGGLYDADTGLVRFGVRDYDADAGRWTAPEPLGFAAEANWYRYAGGDPVNLIDPTGREFERWNWGWQDFIPYFSSNDERGGSFAGKMLSIPTDVVGGLVAGVAWLCGAENKSELGNNSYFEMTGVPFLPDGNGLTLGHSIFYSDPNPTQSLQNHERQHTYQAETLGPFYLPAHGIAQGVSLVNSGSYSENNPLESGPYPESRGGTPGVTPWPW